MRSLQLSRADATKARIVASVGVPRRFGNVLLSWFLERIPGAGPYKARGLAAVVSTVKDRLEVVRALNLSAAELDELNRAVRRTSFRVGRTRIEEGSIQHITAWTITLTILLIWPGFTIVGLLIGRVSLRDALGYLLAESIFVSALVIILKRKWNHRNEIPILATYLGLSVLVAWGIVTVENHWGGPRLVHFLVQAAVLSALLSFAIMLILLRRDDVVRDRWNRSSSDNVDALIINSAIATIEHLHSGENKHYKTSSERHILYHLESLATMLQYWLPRRLNNDDRQMASWVGEESSKMAAAVRCLKREVALPKPDSWMKVNKYLNDLLLHASRGEWGSLPREDPKLYSNTRFALVLMDILRKLVVAAVPLVFFIAAQRLHLLGAWGNTIVAGALVFFIIYTFISVVARLDQDFMATLAIARDMKSSFLSNQDVVK